MPTPRDDGARTAVEWAVQCGGVPHIGAMRPPVHVAVARGQDSSEGHSSRSGSQCTT